jgi:hypothetical protein
MYRFAIDRSQDSTCDRRSLKHVLRLSTIVLTVVACLGSSLRPARCQEPAPSTPPSPAYRFADRHNSVRLKFDLFENNILIECRIEKSLPAWFIFDTGAAVNVVDAGFAQRLPVKLTGQATLSAAGGDVTGSFIESATIRLPGVEVYRQPLAAISLEMLPAYFGREVRGIIGNDLIRHFVVEIDYSGQTLTFHDPSTYNLAHEPAAIEIVNRGGIPFVNVELSIAGRPPIAALFEIDTGSNRILDVNKPFADAHQILAGLPNSGVIEGVGGAGVGGDTKFLETRIDSLRIGRHTLPGPVVSFSQDAAGFGAGDAAGAIGSDLLRRFTVVLDYQSRRMFLKPNASFKEPFEVDMSGLELITKPDDLHQIQVKAVRAGFPAAAAGLLAGDTILAVDGRPASELDLDQLSKMFRQPDLQYELTVRRGHEVIMATLKLRRAV